MDMTYAGIKTGQYQKQVASDYIDFKIKMEREKWQPIFDVFGAVVFWQSERGRLVDNTKAFDFYQMTKSTPSPS